MRIEHNAQLATLRFDERGLIPVVAQHATNGQVLMVAWANQQALEQSLASGTLWLYSRSRQQLWHKGESSGYTQRVLGLYADCDGDTLLAEVLPAGPACHTGARSCFNRAPTLRALADVIDERVRSPQEGYTGRLLQDANLRLKKLGEEATELALACASAQPAHVRAEAADLLYHMLVAAAAAGVSLEDVLAELNDRLIAGAGAPPATGILPATERHPESPGPATAG